MTRTSANPFLMLRSFESLSPSQVVQLRKPPSNRAELRYFVFRGLVFDVRDFTQPVDANWLTDGSAFMISFYRKDMLLVKVRIEAKT